MSAADLTTWAFAAFACVALTAFAVAIVAAVVAAISWFFSPLFRGRVEEWLDA